MEERSIKELLILLRDYFPKAVKEERGALCFALYDMRDKQLITYNEKYAVEKYLFNNIPASHIDHAPYFFPEGQLEPRIEYLNGLISKL